MRLAVFVSGTGTNLFNIVKKHEDGYLQSEVGVVISDRDCEAIQNSKSAGIQTIVADPHAFQDEIKYGTTLLSALQRHNIDFVVLAGFLKKVPDLIVRSFANKIVNVHPALLPSFGGKGMYGMKVHRAVIDYGCRVSGATVHIVDAEYDHGPVVVQKCTVVKDHDTPESLASRVHQLEYEILPEAIKLFEEDRVKVIGRKVFVS